MADLDEMMTLREALLLLQAKKRIKLKQHHGRYYYKLPDKTHIPAWQQ